MNPQKAWNLLHIFHRIFHRLERNILRQMLPPDNQPTHIPSDVRFFGYDVHIGKDVHIGSGAVFMCVRAPIILKGDNWVGANSTILRGVTVGEGAVIAAGSLVT